MNRLLPGLFALVAACGNEAGFVGEVPTNPVVLQGWLEGGHYLDWRHEPAIHVPRGPHGQRVLTYLNLPLAASLKDGNPVHGAESAAVAELYVGGLVTGWAVSVKTSDGEGGDTWYWYEMSDRNDPTMVVEGQGLPDCVGCHTAGVDHTFATWP